MSDILLTVLMLAVFAAWFYAADRIGKYVNKKYHGYAESSAPHRKSHKTGHSLRQ